MRSRATGLADLPPPRSTAADTAVAAVSGHTRAAYEDAMERGDTDTRWLAAHPRFGAAP